MRWDPEGRGGQGGLLLKAQGMTAANRLQSSQIGLRLRRFLDLPLLAQRGPPMSLSLKLLILAAVLIGDVIAGGLVIPRMLARGDGLKAIIVAGGLLSGWVFLAVILFVIL